MRKQLLLTMMLSLAIGFLTAQTVVIDEFTGNASSGLGEASGQPDWGSGTSTITYENDMMKSDYTWINADWFPRAVWYHFDEYADFSATPVMMIKFMVTDNFNDEIPVRFDLYGEATINGVVEDTVETNAAPWEYVATNGEWYELSDNFTANDRWGCTYWGGGIDRTPVDSSRINGFEAFASYGNAMYNNQAGTLFIDYIKMTSASGTEELLYGKVSEFSLAVYPNPANDVVTVNAENMISTINILDVTGRVVETIDNVNMKKTQVDISNFTSGLYFVSVEDTEGKFVSKKLQVK